MSNYARFALLLVAILQFAVPALPSLGIGETNAVRALSEGVPPELPFGIFFSIWGPIFLGFLALGVLAVFAPRDIDGDLIAPLALAGLGSVIWMLSAQGLGLVWLDFLLLLPILFFAWEAAYRLDRLGGFDGTWQRLLSCFTIGLLAGWISVAVSISVPDLVRGIAGIGVSDYVWVSLWLALIPASLLAFVFATRVSRSLWYFVAVAWGLTGVGLNNWMRTELHALAIATAVVGAIVLLYRLKRGASGSAVFKVS